MNNAQLILTGAVFEWKQTFLRKQLLLFTQLLILHSSATFLAISELLIFKKDNF